MSNTDENRTDDVIEISSLIGTLARQRNALIAASAISIFLGFFYTVVKKPVWEGEFQIVLELKDPQDPFSFGLLNSRSSSSTRIPSGLSVFAGPQASSLATEVSILKSPSVLRPVYNFIKEKKSKNGVYKGLSYRNWVKEYLDVDLKKNTSVLKLSYRDVDRSVVIPVLTKISETYQKYSGLDREKGITRAIDYLEDQLSKVKKSSQQSLQEYQYFASKYRLGETNGLPILIDDGASNDSSGIVEPSSSFFKQLESLESEILKKSKIYTPQSRHLQELKKSRDALKEAAERPNDILLKYRELRRKAISDEDILVTIEYQLRKLNLERARKQNPWELISNPSLLDKPVAPNKFSVILFSTLFGLISGSVIAFIREKKSGLIYELEDFITELSFPLLKTLNLENIYENNNSLQLISEKIKNFEKEGSVALIPINESIAKDTRSIAELLKKFLGDRNIIVTDNLNETRSCSVQILITSSGICTFNKLNNFKQDLGLQGGNVMGWIYIENPHAF